MPKVIRNKGKNVLLVTVDHWPGRLLGCNGRADLLSPTIDNLARCGIRFTNAYSNTPVCIPARRELMTGTSARTHGDRTHSHFLEMPDIPTIAQTFRDNGYQAYGVGKLHVYPQRSRIGFDDVILNAEGRRVRFPHEMRQDDYTRYLAREGCAGLEHAHAMSNNDYSLRPWHLPEETHQSAWTAREMSEQILRRDPTKPAFWYCSFAAPHPPIVPPQAFIDMYKDVEIEWPFVGEWATPVQELPYCLQYYESVWDAKTEKLIRDARKGFHALCTQVDYYLKLVIGTLREEGELDDTIIAITSDHGDMLGNHGLWAKNLFYEDSTKVPFIIVPTLDSDDLGYDRTDDRLVELKDMMPTLLDMCGLPIPTSVEGLSLVDEKNSRQCVYGELWEDDRATRMIRTATHKLIYYAVGNTVQLFDMEKDPNELKDVSDAPEYREVRNDLTQKLVSELYGGDTKWVSDGKLVGLPDKPFKFRPVQENCGVLKHREFFNQRGIR